MGTQRLSVPPGRAFITLYALLMRYNMTCAPPTVNSAVLYPEDLDLRREEAIERMGDQEVYLEIAHYFSSHLEDSLSDLAQAFAVPDLPAATRLAHSLKSNCATVGAEALREQCCALEQLCREENLEPARQLYENLVPRMLALRDALAAL